MFYVSEARGLAIRGKMCRLISIYAIVNIQPWLLASPKIKDASGGQLAEKE